MARPVTRGGIAVLVVSNLLGGIGVASGVAVGGLVAESLGGTAFAGLGQATSVLGAAVAAVPLAALATSRGRRWALATGYLLATAGAALVISAILTSQLWILLVGLALFGVSNAANLQSRYAAADLSPARARGRSMAVVIWATTVGAVAGPNLTAPGDRVGLALGLPHLAGPYLFSVVAFALGALVVGLLYPGQRRAAVEYDDAPPRTVGPLAALRWAVRHPQARFAVVLVATAHAVMIVVMVMTPVHMQHEGMTLELVGIVISLHVLGMYGLSPVFGTLVDRWGAMRTAWLGIGVLATALAIGLVAGGGTGGSVLTAVALTVLGLGWSASLIAASAHLSAVATDDVRVPLQGVADAGMNYAGAAAAALAGPVLAWGGFVAVNAVGAALLIPVLLCGAAALRAARQPGVAVADSLAG